MSAEKILVVDDSQVILTTLKMKLQSQGYRVITAEDGGEASLAVRKERPDLILLDINFPPDVAHGGGVPWDGFLILDWVQRMDEGRNVPVIIISGENKEAFSAKLKNRVIEAIFTKPIDNSELMNFIKMLFEKRAKALQLEVATPP
jgi:DNA-binding response OmpR family regulator